MLKPRGALRGREVEGRRKRPCLLGQGTGDTGMGPEHRQPCQEEDVSPAGGGGGWQRWLSDSASRPRGPTNGGSGGVEGSSGQGDPGNWRGG